MSKHFDDDERNLIRYHRYSPKSPLGRVAPCLDAMANKLEVVRCCCDLLAMEPDGDSGIKQGVSRIVREVTDELCEASEVLQRELENSGEKDEVTS